MDLEEAETEKGKAPEQDVQEQNQTKKKTQNKKIDES